MTQTFPIDQSLPELLDVFSKSHNVVLSAPPGAGKTTRVPLAILESKWMEGKKLIMLEPRRLAARRAAEYMASLLGERVGASVGYRTRGDSRVSTQTRIEVVTEGVLTHLLHETPDLPSVAMLIFDEFHERSIHADLGLALTLDVQENLRDDLRILIMSATLEGVAIARLLRGAPVVESVGRSFPVETRYLQFKPQGHIEPKTVETIHRALREEPDDVLVFLPGQREIRRVESLLNQDGVSSEVAVHTLYGDASDMAQRAALAPAPSGMRKVILSTSIAETSLTIDGVRVVVDAGFARSARFDPRRGMSGLVTLPVSRAAADQRRGRAGRQQPGVCYRLWTEEQHESLPPFATPEILSADLAPLALDLARWGTSEASNLRFLDPPPSAHLAQAQNLLHSLGAVNDAGALTSHGRLMSDLPLHPRLAHMIIRGKERGIGPLGCDVAALLEEKDVLRSQRGSDVDFTLRVHALRTGSGIDRSIRNRIQSESRRLRECIGVVNGTEPSDHDTGVLLALAYPERVARRRSSQSGRYQMANGTGALLPEWSLLGREEFLAVADVDGIGTEVRIFLAAPLLKEGLMDVCADRIIQQDELLWNQQGEEVIARRVQLLDALVIDEQKAQPHGPYAVTAMIDGIKQMGIASLPWGKESESLKTRSEWLRTQHLVADDWPDLGDTHLIETLESWLAPFLEGITRRPHLAHLDLAVPLKSLFSYSQLRELERLAPLTLEVPTGSHIKLDYSSGTQAVLAVRLQEMFGQTDTPLIAGGRVKVLIHLLSPAGRPLAVTQDLRSFWTNAYPDVRKEMRGRYPKHSWPEDPFLATPTRRTRRRISGSA